MIICLTVRSAVPDPVIGMMIGSLYSIIQGPTTLSEPQSAMSFSTFNILFFIFGILILVGLQLLKYFMDRKEG